MRPRRRRRRVALTRAGHLVVSSSLALLALGWYLGLLELLALGSIGIVLVVLAAARTALRRPQVTVRRHVLPTYLHAGGTSRVRLEVTNPTGRPSATIVLHDEVTGTGGATVQVGRLAPGETAGATYRLPTRTRGRYTVGPLRSSLADPFGLTERAGVAVPASVVVVFPPITQLAPLGQTAGLDLPVGAGHPRRLGRGDELHGLRSYVPGDDLRTVHWPTSAHLDDLVVRQHSQERGGTVTVLVDLRSRVHDAASLEAVVEAAASVVALLEDQAERYRLVTTSGARTDLRSGPGHLRTCLELLAVAGPDDAPSLRQVATALATGTGSLVVITAGDPDTAADAVGDLPFAGVVAVVLHATHPPTPRRTRPDAHVLAVPPDRTFAATWNAAVASQPSPVAR